MYPLSYLLTSLHYLSISLFLFPHSMIGIGKSTDKRWFTVQYSDNTEDRELALCYFKTDRTTEPRGWLFLRDVKEISEEAAEDGNTVMVIDHPSRTMRLYAASPGQTKHWIKRLKQLVEELRHPVVVAAAEAKPSSPRRSQAKHVANEDSAAQYKEDASRSPQRGSGKQPPQQQPDHIEGEDEQNRFQASRGGLLSRSYEEGLGASLGPRNDYEDGDASGYAYEDRGERGRGGKGGGGRAPPPRRRPPPGGNGGDRSGGRDYESGQTQGGSSTSATGRLHEHIRARNNSSSRSETDYGGDEMFPMEEEELPSSSTTT